MLILRQTYGCRIEGSILAILACFLLIVDLTFLLGFLFIILEVNLEAIFYLNVLLRLSAFKKFYSAS